MSWVYGDIGQGLGGMLGAYPNQLGYAWGPDQSILDSWQNAFRQSQQMQQQNYQAIQNPWTSPVLKAPESSHMTEDTSEFGWLRKRVQEILWYS